MNLLSNKFGHNYFVKFIFFPKYTLPNYEVYIVIWLFSHVELQGTHKIKSFGLPNVQILFRSAKTFAPKNQVTHHLFFHKLNTLPSFPLPIYSLSKVR
jgi:hypothetical protein